MKRLLLTLALLLTPSLAFGQCSGVYPSGSVCGNSTLAPAPPTAINIGNIVTAVKKPVDYASIGSNVTLSGEQTLDGVLTSNSRVLLWNQSTASQNGCYVTSSGAWARCTDSVASGQLIQGTQYYVIGGTTNKELTFAVTTANPILIGTSSITFDRVPGFAQLTRTYLGVVTNVAAPGAVTRSTELKLADTYSVKDFGAVCDGSTDDTAAVQAAINAAGGSYVIPRWRQSSILNISGSCLITSGLVARAQYIVGPHTGAGPFIIQCGGGGSGLVWGGADNTGTLLTLGDPTGATGDIDFEVNGCVLGGSLDTKKPAIALLMNNVQVSAIRHNYIQNTYDGIVCNVNCLLNRFEHNFFMRVYTDDLRIGVGNANWISHNEFGWYGRYGINIGGGDINVIDSNSFEGTVGSGGSSGSGSVAAVYTNGGNTRLLNNRYEDANTAPGVNYRSVIFDPASNGYGSIEGDIFGLNYSGPGSPDYYIQINQGQIRFNNVSLPPAGSGFGIQNLSVYTSTWTGGFCADPAQLFAGVANRILIAPCGNKFIATEPGGKFAFDKTSLGLTGDMTQATWGMNGVKYTSTHATITDATPGGTLAAGATNVFDGAIIAAFNSGGVVYTNYFGSYFTEPVAGAFATLTNKYALGADSLLVAKQAVVGTNGATGGLLALNGSTSGSVAIKVPAIAGTGTVFQLPPDNGTSGYLLRTDGAGISTWVPAGTGTVTSVTCNAGLTGGAITASGTCALDLAHANTWTALQQFNDGEFALKGGTSGTLVQHAAAIAASSVITWPAGTTDFSATGGTSQVVKQISSGAAFTVARLACADLSDSGTGCAGTIGNYLPLAGGTLSGALTASASLILGNGTPLQWGVNAAYPAIYNEPDGLLIGAQNFSKYFYLTFVDAGTTFQLGAASSSGAAVPQILTMQGSSGASATPALFTIAGSDQTGTTSTGGDLLLRGGNGTSANGNVRFGTVNASGVGVQVGTIAIKDAAGNLRYLMYTNTP